MRRETVLSRLFEALSLSAVESIRSNGEYAVRRIKPTTEHGENPPPTRLSLVTHPIKQTLRAALAIARLAKWHQVPYLIAHFIVICFLAVGVYVT